MFTKDETPPVPNYQFTILVKHSTLHIWNGNDLGKVYGTNCVKNNMVI